MAEFPKCYTTLFNAVTDALKSLENQDYGTAKRLLVQGQCEAEGEYIAGTVIERKLREGTASPKEEI